jgi:hypothetical protein
VQSRFLHEASRLNLRRRPWRCQSVLEHVAYDARVLHGPSSTGTQAMHCYQVPQRKCKHTDGGRQNPPSAAPNMTADSLGSVSISPLPDRTTRRGCAATTTAARDGWLRDVTERSSSRLDLKFDSIPSA